MDEGWFSSLTRLLPGAREAGDFGGLLGVPHLEPGGFVIAAGPRRAVEQAMSVGQIGERLVQLQVDVASTRITRPRQTGTTGPRVIQLQPRLHFDLPDIDRVGREIAYQRPDLVIIGATSSQFDDLRWAATVADRSSAPTVLAIASDDVTSSELLGKLGLSAGAQRTGSPSGLAKAGDVRLFVANPRLPFRYDAPDVQLLAVQPFDMQRFNQITRLLSGTETISSWLSSANLAVASVATEIPPIQPRYVNTVVYSAGKRVSITQGEVLDIDTDYILGIGIGPRREDSLLAGDASFPDEVLPRLARRLAIFVRSSSDLEEEVQHGNLYLPVDGPAFSCPIADQAPDETVWESFNHEACLDHHGELAEFRIPRRIGPGLIELEALIYVGAAVVHVQTVQLSVREGTGATAKVTYRLVHSFDKLPVLTDRFASVVEGADHLTINSVAGTGTFSFRFTDTTWSPAAVGVRKALTGIYFAKVSGEKYLPKYPNVDVPPDDYRQSLCELATVGRGLFNRIFNTAASAALAPMLINEAAARGRPPVVQVARTAQRPFVVPWQVMYDLPMEHPDIDLRVCSSVGEYGPGGSGDWPPPATCPHREFHDQVTGSQAGSAILCPWGFLGLALLIEVPEPPPERRSIDHVVSESPVALAVVPGTGSGLDNRQLATHLHQLRAQVRGFPRDPKDVVTAASNLRDALEPTTVDIVYLLSHAQQAASGLSDELIFPDQSLMSEDIAVWTRDYWRPDHWNGRRPLIVLNACHTAEIVQSTMAGFVTNFVAAGAAGVIGTETLIDQMTASKAMEEFLGQFSSGSTVGEAIRLMRWRLLGRGNLLGFSYTPYSAASLRLRPAQVAN